MRIERIALHDTEMNVEASDLDPENTTLLYASNLFTVKSAFYGSPVNFSVQTWINKRFTRCNGFVTAAVHIDPPCPQKPRTSPHQVESCLIRVMYYKLLNEKRALYGYA
jgi:hypothetical protein